MTELLVVTLLCAVTLLAFVVGGLFRLSGRLEARVDAL